jgi:hypothetical protein
VLSYYKHSSSLNRHKPLPYVTYMMFDHTIFQRENYIFNNPFSVHSVTSWNGTFVAKLKYPGPELESRHGQGSFTSSKIQAVPGAHPVSYKMGTGFLSRGVKRPGRGVDHSPHSIADFKNEWSYTSDPPYVFMTWTEPVSHLRFYPGIVWRAWG